MTLTGGIIPVKGRCTVTLTVSSATAGSYTNTIAANALITGPAGGNSAAADATLIVGPPIAPTIAQSFSPASVGENATSTLTLKLSNTNAYALTQAALTDTLPSNLSISTSPAASDDLFRILVNHHRRRYAHGRHHPRRRKLFGHLDGIERCRG